MARNLRVRQSVSPHILRRIEGLFSAPPSTPGLTGTLEVLDNFDRFLDYRRGVTERLNIQVYSGSFVTVV
jgi:hypothetical protein